LPITKYGMNQRMFPEFSPLLANIKREPEAWQATRNDASPDPIDVAVFRLGAFPDRASGLARYA